MWIAADIPALGGVSMAYDIKALKTVADCRLVIERANRAGDADLERRAFGRLVELGGERHLDPLIAAFYSSLAIYECTLPKGRANYVRRKLSKLGGGVEAVKHILIDWCTDKRMSTGFHHLVGKGLKAHVGEYMVGITFPERFPADVVEAARDKLVAQGIIRRDEIPPRDRQHVNAGPRTYGATVAGRAHAS
jgi:hypothetical protein